MRGVIDTWWLAPEIARCFSRRPAIREAQLRTIYRTTSFSALSYCPKAKKNMIGNNRIPLGNKSMPKYQSKKSAKNWSRHLHLAALSQAPSDRYPARHLTVKMPLHSETCLKCHLHCLGPRAAIAGFPGEWVAAARFVLGAAGGFLWKWDRDGEKIECLLNQTDHYSQEFARWT